MKKEMRCSREECKADSAPFPHKTWNDKKGDFSGPECEGPGEEVDIPYDNYTFEDLACKIDSEGFAYFFTQWISPQEIHDPQLERLVLDYRLAHEYLGSYLREHGGLL